MKPLLFFFGLLGMIAFNAKGQVTTLAQNLTTPFNVASDGSFVYWVENTSNGNVKKISVNGGSITTLASGLSYPTAIKVDASFVFWIERNNGSNGTLKKVSINGGTVTELVTGLQNAQNHFALDNNNIYWGDGKSGGGGVIKKVSKDGGTVTTLVNSGIMNMTTAIAVDNDYVYFYDDINSIKTVPVNGGTVSTIGSGSPAAMELNGSDIYWVEYGNGMVKKMPKTGGTVTTLVSGADSPGNLVVDGSNVFYIEYSNSGKVQKVSVNGGTPSIISYNANTIGIAIDNTNLYWVVSVSSNGKIQKTSLIPCTPPASSSITASGALTFCQGKSVLLTATSCSGCNYTWSNGMTGQSITVSKSGSYSITVDNGCGQSSSPITTITVNTNPTDTVFSTLDSGNCKGTATITASGGKSPYSYNWSTTSSQTTSVATNLCFGKYSVTVTDANNCTITDTIEVLKGNSGCTTFPLKPTVQVNKCQLAASTNASATYQWYLNGNAIQGAKSQFYTVNDNGYYSVQIDSNGCTNTSDNVFLQCSVGINEASEKNFLKISPNPTTGTFTLALEGFQNEEVQIKVMNVLGEEIYVSQKEKASGNYSKEISLRNTVAGIYLVQVKVGEKVRHSKLVVE